MSEQLTAIEARLNTLESDNASRDKQQKMLTTIVGAVMVVVSSMTDTTEALSKEASTLKYTVGNILTHLVQ